MDAAQPGMSLSLSQSILKAPMEGRCTTSCDFVQISENHRENLTIFLRNAPGAMRPLQARLHDLWLIRNTLKKLRSFPHSPPSLALRLER